MTLEFQVTYPPTHDGSEHALLLGVAGSAATDLAQLI
jgi:hypothetical protein